MSQVLARIPSYLQSAGSFGIALSLLLVAFELKQSRDIAEAQLYSERFEFNYRIQLQDFDLDVASKALGKLMTGEVETDKNALYQAEAYVYAQFLNLDVMHFHRAKNLLDEEVWSKQLEGLTPPMCTPAFRELVDSVWSGGFGYRNAFAGDINQWLNNLDCPEEPVGN